MGKTTEYSPATSEADLIRMTEQDKKIARAVFEDYDREEPAYALEGIAKATGYGGDTCVCCGAPVPEGHQVCWICAHGGLGPQDDGCKDGACPIKWKEDE